MGVDRQARNNISDSVMECIKFHDPQHFTIDRSNAFIYLFFFFCCSSSIFHVILCILFSSVCCSMVSFRAILILFGSLGGLCSVIVTFPGYTYIYII